MKDCKSYGMGVMKSDMVLDIAHLLFKRPRKWSDEGIVLLMLHVKNTCRGNRGVTLGNQLGTECVESYVREIHQYLSQRISPKWLKTEVYQHMMFDLVPQKKCLIGFSTNYNTNHFTTIE